MFKDRGSRKRGGGGRLGAEERRVSAGTYIIRRLEQASTRQAIGG